MDSIPIIDRTGHKRPVPAELRQPQILALQAAGLTLQQIADVFNVSIKSIQRDLEVISAAKQNFNTSTLDALMTPLRIAISPEQRAARYAELAISAKNEAVSLGALQRIDDLDGIVTQKELVRTRRDDAATTVQPMFILPANSHISVTVDTTSSRSEQNGLGQGDVRDITPSSQSATPTATTDTESGRKS